MQINKKLVTAALVSAGLLLPSLASATNGYFAIGYGPNSRSVAGANTALAEDSMNAASNPAAIGFLGHRADFGVELFSPIREADSFTAGGFLGESGKNYFLVPGGGYVRPLGNGVTAGITIYANGGMNTDYDTVAPGFPNMFGGIDHLGVDLMQLIFAPTIAYKLNENHSIGASLLIGYQRFKAYGLQNFCGFKVGGPAACAPFPGSDAANEGLTNQNYDSTWGAGIRVGWQGRLTDSVTMGAAYASKIQGEFDKYDQLFAEGGDFDIPANWNIGIAVQATPKLTVTADVQHIEYDDVKSISNPGPSLGLCGPGTPFCEGQTPLGTNDGLGFGWDDMTIFKLGMIYEANSKWTYRAGISHGEQPIDDDQLLFNVLAPAVIETHITAGFNYRPNGKDSNEWTFAYMLGVDNEEKGCTPAFFAMAASCSPDNTRLEMYQHAFELGYSWKF
jgi:long-chain fatty acid transport protein